MVISEHNLFHIYIASQFFYRLCIIHRLVVLMKLNNYEPVPIFTIILLNEFGWKILVDICLHFKNRAVLLKYPYSATYCKQTNKCTKPQMVPLWIHLLTTLLSPFQHEHFKYNFPRECTL